MPLFVARATVGEGCVERLACTSGRSSAGCACRPRARARRAPARRGPSCSRLRLHLAHRLAAQPVVARRARAPRRAGLMRRERVRRSGRRRRPSSRRRCSRSRRYNRALLCFSRPPSRLTQPCLLADPVAPPTGCRRRPGWSAAAADAGLAATHSSETTTLSAWIDQSLQLIAADREGERHREDRAAHRRRRAARDSRRISSFAVMPGEAVAIVGASGSGKSTLLGLLAGPGHADRGRGCDSTATDLFALDEDGRAALRASARRLRVPVVPAPAAR